MIYRKYIKRLLDIIISALALIILSPVLLILIIAVRVLLGAPVFFHQDRPGRNEKVFRLYKFRTMTDARDQSGKLLPDSVRLTRFGRLLRKTSLYELPELFNILKGDMSIVGPRPLLVEYLPWYTERERLRHTVRPGLTGLAQASGRTYVDWDRRFELDAQYVEQLSLSMDLRVIAMTVKAVLSHGDGVAEDTSAIEGNFAEIRKQQKLKEQQKINEYSDSQCGNKK